MITTLGRLFRGPLATRKMKHLLAVPRRFETQSKPSKFNVLFDDEKGIIGTQKFVRFIHFIDWIALLSITWESPFLGMMYLFFLHPVFKNLKEEYLQEMQTRIRLFELSEDGKFLRLTYTAPDSEPETVPIGEVTIQKITSTVLFSAIWLNVNGTAHLLQFTDRSRHNGREDELLEAITKVGKN